jgi:hypothetical protein
MSDQEKGKIEDTGLGLGDFLSRGAEKASPRNEKETKPAEKAATDEKTSVVAETKPEVKAAEAKAETPKVSEKQATSTTPATPEAGQQTGPTTPNWDDESNPWKKKASENEKRYRDTHREWNATHQQNQEMQRQIQVMQAKLDGTYDPAIHEPPPLDPHAVRSWGAVEGRAETSYEASVMQHGQEAVDSTLARYKEIFAQDLETQSRVLQSKHPVATAMEAVRAYDLFAKYQTTDPAQLVARIEQELRAKLVPEIEESTQKKLLKGLASKNAEPRGLSNVAGGSGAGDKAIASDNKGRSKSLGAIFGR